MMKLVIVAPSPVSFVYFVIVIVIVCVSLCFIVSVNVFIRKSTRKSGIFADESDEWWEDAEYWTWIVRKELWIIFESTEEMKSFWFKSFSWLLHVVSS